MNKKGCIIMSCILLLGLTSCGGGGKAGNTDDTIEITTESIDDNSESTTNENDAVDEDRYKVLDSVDKELKIVVPSEYECSEDKNRYINYELYEAGADYKVSFVNLNCSLYDEDYSAQVEAYINNGGEADIISSGTEYSTLRNMPSFLQSGIFMELSDVLEDSDLYKLYDQKMWDSVSIDGEIYTIPNEKLSLYNPVLIFNTDYIDSSIIEEYKTDNELDISEVILSLEDIYKAGSISDAEACPIYLQNMGSDIVSYFNMVDLNPLVFSVETGEAMYPFEVPEIYDFMWEMNSIYHDGLLRGNFLEEGSDYYLEDNVLETGKFSIYIGMVSEIYDNSNYEILEAPFYLGGRYGSSLGIYSESENSQDALNFIYLSRTNSDLANALVYGEEGKDYQMLDGVASDMNGEEIYPYYNETILGIYDKAAASSSDRTQNIDKRQYRDVMMTKAKDSGITGFALDEEISEDAYWEIKALGEDEYFVGLISAPDKNHYEEIFEDMEACSEEAVAYKNKVNEDIENYRK